ncbi:MAG: hypothetical protein IJV94_02715 [Bacilli bacterium]|nr:hypothetical protein [Bacilli bacterium]
MSKKNSNITFIAMAFVMIVFMSVAARLMKIPDIITQVATILGTFIGTFLVFSLTYDLGKYIFAKAAGFRFISYRVLTSIRAKDAEGKVKGFYHKSLFKTIELFMYKDTNKDRKSAVIYCIGGSIFNTIIALALIIVGLVMQDGDNIRSILFISGITGFFCIAMNLVPMNSSTSNDGSYLQAIKSSDESLELFYTNLEYLNHICKYKPTEFDFSRFNIKEEFNPVNPTHANAFINKVKYQIFVHDFAEAQRLINSQDANISLFVEDIMYDLKLKAIFLKTMLNNDEEALIDRDNLSGDSKDASKAKSIDRSIENYAFYKFSSMDEYASEEAYDQAIRLMEKSPYQGLVKEQRELLDFLKMYRFTKPMN